jgi:3'(2'), 5'-bisphosphate nucleotidase
MAHTMHNNTHIAAEQQTSNNIDATIREYLLAAQLNAAVRAGAEIMKIYKGGDDYDIAIKSDSTPITIADRVAHNTIKEALGATRIPILSEEGRQMLYEERRNWELFWLVDPLDGTVEFIKGNNEFTVNIALMLNNICISAIVYVPYHHKMYIAERGHGAWVMQNVAPVEDANYTYEQIEATRQQLPLSSAEHTTYRVAVSRSHQTPETHSHIETLRTKYPDLEVVEQGSSYKFCLLAEGMVDYYIRTTTTSEWDTAAGELILAEAGGVTTSYPAGEPLLYNKESLDNPWFVAKRSR